METKKRKMINKLFSWDFVAGILIGILIGFLISSFIYQKNVDSLIRERETERTKNEIVNQVIDYLTEIERIKKWNDQTVIVEIEEEGEN